MAINDFKTIINEITEEDYVLSTDELGKKTYIYV